MCFYIKLYFVYLHIERDKEESELSKMAFHKQHETGKIYLNIYLFKLMICLRDAKS